MTTQNILHPLVSSTTKNETIFVVPIYTMYFRISSVKDSIDSYVAFGQATETMFCAYSVGKVGKF